MLTADSPVFSASTLEQVFASCFESTLNTRLTGGFSEPLYQPSSREGEYSCIRYREDFFASALHEVAHWCIAGPARRKLVDFGYWYTADGRTALEQQAFENVEYQPQALEWFFAKACGYSFRVSSDNLNAQAEQLASRESFEARVVEQALHWCRTGLPANAAIFFEALCREYGSDAHFGNLSFNLAELQSPVALP